MIKSGISIIFVMIIIIGFIPTYAQTQSKCGVGTVFDPVKNTCVLEGSEMTTKEVPTKIDTSIKEETDLKSEELTKIEAIKNEFYLELEEFLSTEVTQEDVGGFRDFLGEEKYQKFQELNMEIEEGFLPNIPIEGYTGMSLEEDRFVIEILEDWIKYFKQEINQRIQRLDNSLNSAKEQINALNISDIEKQEHTKEIEEKKLVYETVIVSSMTDFFQQFEDTIEKKKKQLDIKSELTQGKSQTKTNGGGCLIATAAFGSELVPQIQLLREVRDNIVMSTTSGAVFMTGFNQLYYSFSPTIADWERESPIFKETVKLFIMPMISTLSIMTLAQDGSESDVLAVGISIIVLNLGMYVMLPIIVMKSIIDSRKSQINRLKFSDKLLD